MIRPPTPTGSDPDTQVCVPPPLPEDHEIDLFAEYATAAGENGDNPHAYMWWAARFQAAVRLLVAERQAAEAAQRRDELIGVPALTLPPPTHWFPE